MTIQPTPITLGDLTTAEVSGSGVFDVLMRANKAHLDEQFKNGRIIGTDYATVYLGSLQAVMNTALQYLLEKEKRNLDALLQAQQIDLAAQQVLNAVTENTVLVATECKLRAEFDLLKEQVIKTASETAVLNQKLVTERAQTIAIGTDDDSVIGRQKILYKAQADGFVRDAEQKTADLMIKSWSVRRNTDEATVADGTNMLNDTAIGRAVNKLLTGVGA